MDYASMLARAAGLIPFVMVLVAAIRKMGLEGVWLTRASFVVGLIVGVASEAAAGYQPLFVWWFASVFYGLIIGACACGAYDLGSQWFGPKPAKILAVDQSGTVYNPETISSADAAMTGSITKAINLNNRVTALEDAHLDDISNRAITADDINMGKP